MKKAISILTLTLVLFSLSSQPIGRSRSKDVKAASSAEVTKSVTLLGFVSPTVDLRSLTMTQLGILHYTRPAGTGAATTYIPVVYSREETTAGDSGMVIDTLTTQGTATGTAIFSTIYSVTATPTSYDTTKVYSVNVDSIGQLNKKIYLRASYRSLGDTLGVSNLPAAAGTKFYLTIFGK